MANPVFEWPPASSGSGGVTSVNAATGAITIVAGAGISVTTVGTTITVANTGSGGSVTPNKETFVLSPTNITNQFVDLAHVALTGSLLIQVKGLGAILEGALYDYSVSYTGGAGGNTRITFLNDLATGGAAALVATDVMQVNYAY